MIRLMIGFHIIRNNDDGNNNTKRTFGKKKCITESTHVTFPIRSSPINTIKQQNKTLFQPKFEEKKNNNKVSKNYKRKL